MKKVIGVLIILAFVVFIHPATPVQAEAPTSMGTVISGQEYSGTAPLTSTGNPLPVRFELPVEQNSMIRLQLYTQTGTDSSLYIEHMSSPYNNPEGYGNFAGKNLTVVGDFYNPKPNMYSSSSFCVTADQRNTAAYTEVYSDLAEGNYYIILTGMTYRFRIILEPLLYQGTAEITNATMENAASYTLGKEQDDILITNGILNGNYYDYNSTSNRWYRFNAQKGTYTLTFHTDGFFQGTASINDEKGYTIQGNNILEIDFPVGVNGDGAGTYEEHTAKAGSYTMEVTFAETGTYYLNIFRKAWTIGSYRFSIDGEANAETEINSINISPSKGNINVGNTIGLKATAFYSDGSEMDVTDFVTWKCTNDKIVTVNDYGKVKGVRVGSATVTATLEGVNKSIKITVTSQDEVNKLSAKRATIYLKTGSTATNKITAILTDGSKKEITTKAVYKSSSSLLTIAKNGQMKAAKKGEYVVTVTYGGKKTSFKVIVK